MITHINLVILIMATISLFLFGLRGFSDEIKQLNADTLAMWMEKLSSNRIKGLLFGTVVTAIIHSSSAVTSITVALVDSGILSFRNALSVMLGANIGTTATAWLVTFKLNHIGPFFIVLGTLIGALPIKINLYARAIFYFGFILFSLDLVNDVLRGLKDNPDFIAFIAYDKPLYLNLLIGLVATLMVQSSSVVSGLVVILATQGLLNIYESVAIVVGCNVGTTSTALLSSIHMNKLAKQCAQANFAFNLFGFILFIPLIKTLANFVQWLHNDIGFQVAFAHLIFNLVTALLLLPFLNKIADLFKARRD